MVDFLFYLFSAIILVSAGMVVAGRKPVTAAMGLLVVMAGTAAMFVLLEAFFLGLLQVLVYAGAVVVLFLFIIMLIDPETGGRRKPGRLSVGLSVIALICLFGGVFYLFGGQPEGLAGGTLDTTPAVGNISKEYGYYLFSIYLLPLMVVGFLLLIAMIGVVLISKRQKSGFAGPIEGGVGEKVEEVAS